MSKKSTHAAEADDWYVEPAWCVDLLFQAERFGNVWLWDPACGIGTIPSAASVLGYNVFCSDIVVRPQCPFAVVECDFLRPDNLARNAQLIVCNPPYKHAEAFIRRAIGLGIHTHAWLLQRDFPYSQRRYKLFTEHPPQTIYHLSSRPSCTPGSKLVSGEMKQSGGSVDYCWIVWVRGYAGPTITKWLIQSPASVSPSSLSRGYLAGASAPAPFFPTPAPALPPVAPAADRVLTPRVGRRQAQQEGA